MRIIFRKALHRQKIGKMPPRLLPPVLMTILFLLPNQGRAQVAGLPETETIHWAYSAAFGTGYYRISDEAEIYVFRIHPRWRKAFSFRNHLGGRTFFFELRFPVTLGLHSFSIEELLSPQFQQISFTPGAMLQIPLLHNWDIQLFGHVGWGSELKGSRSHAVIYWGGINSRVAFRLFNTDWALLNGLSSYGYTPDEGETGDLSALITGLEWNHRMWGLKWGGEDLILRTSISHFYYFEHLDFLFSDRSPVSLSWEWEIGASIHKESRLKILIFSFERLGVAYRFSPNTSGVRIFTSAVFR